MPSSPDQPATVPDALPEVFGHYRIVKRLGKGGMGTVYLAVDTRLDRKVALKVCHLADNQRALARFKREAKAAAALRHPNLCPVHDFDVINGVPYFTMAYIEGPTLDRWVEQRGGISQRDAAVITRKVAVALQAAHEAGVVHRDLKPSNIALDKGEPVVLDFGLARQNAAVDVRVTGTGSIVGTPAYMSPEQVTGDAAMGPSSDVYSLGVVLYELLTNQLPFDGPAAAVLGQIMVSTPKPPHELKPQLDRQLEDICLKALAKKPADRWLSMADFAKALTAWLRAGRVSRPKTGSATELNSADKAIAPRHEPIAATDPLIPKAILLGPTPLDDAALRESDKTALISIPKTRYRFSRPVAILLVIVSLCTLLFQTWHLVPLNDPAPFEVSTDDPKNIRIGPPAPLGARAADFTNSLGMQFMLVSRGSFLMGGGRFSLGSSEVTIPYDFYMGRFEITQQEWEYITRVNPSYFCRIGNGQEAVKDVTENNLKYFPVEQVSQADATIFLQLLNAKVTDGGWRYRLPTNTEWEYACRGGNLSNKLEMEFDFYYDKPSHRLLHTQANFDGNVGRPCPVGFFMPNRLGIYDMHGNIAEWCDDQNPILKGACRSRGGSWADDSSLCVARGHVGDSAAGLMRTKTIGLRLVRVRDD